MTHFIAWAFGAWAAILAAGLIALYLPVHPGPIYQPKAAAPTTPEPARPAPAPLPPHLIDWREPLNGEDNAEVRPYTPAPVGEPQDDPRLTLPRPGTVQVVPRWVTNHEARLQVEHRRALEAASIELPDPEHILWGAPAGAVA
ncbi:hypothetical protein [Kitasatospora sp. NPDC047058]|uniref:hypothetical protein n=1 Tax=Kitasatospora sp. NPDC047058 TaxID=3155620 RepID=UPI0033F1C8D3